MAEDSVVVTKSQPEKAGNRLEDKTGTTRSVVCGGWCRPKAASECEGRKFTGWDTVLAVKLLKALC
ncbi:MAG: hypothetical protein ACYSQZ_09245 [Planctomycetota bacterium]